MKKALLALLLSTSLAYGQDAGLRGGGLTSRLNITTATVVKAAPGVSVSISVTTAGSTAGSANDTTTTGGVAAGNLMYAIPNSVGVFYVPFPFLNGLVITPGTAQVISVSYE